MASLVYTCCMLISDDSGQGSAKVIVKTARALGLSVLMVTSCSRSRFTFNYIGPSRSQLLFYTFT